MNSPVASLLAVPKEPIVFLKPTTSYITKGQLIMVFIFNLKLAFLNNVLIFSNSTRYLLFTPFLQLPQSLGTIFYEVELGVVIGKRGSRIPESEALDYVAGYFLALDMTAKSFIVSFPSTVLFY